MPKRTSKKSKPRRKTTVRAVTSRIDWSGPLLLLGMGMVITSLWFSQLSTISRARDTALLRSRTSVSTSQVNTRRFSVPVQIDVGNFLTKSLTPGTYTDGIWSLDDNLPLYLSSAAHPGEAGNIIIYGHNTNRVFGPLRRVKQGELITLRLANGSQRQYSVKVIQTVRTDQVDFLQETDHEILTLYTCSGPLDRNRLLIQAEPTNATVSSLP